MGSSGYVVSSLPGHGHKTVLPCVPALLPCHSHSGINKTILLYKCRYGEKHWGCDTGRLQNPGNAKSFPRDGASQICGRTRVSESELREKVGLFLRIRPRGIRHESS